MNKRVGIMGGTFNPIHNGHLIIAERAVEELDLEEMLFIPNQIPPHRRNEQGLVSGEDRWLMVQLATWDNPRFIPSRIELDGDGVSYTLDTVIKLKSLHPCWDLFFITGADAILKYEWHAFPQLLSLLSGFVILARPGIIWDEVRQKVDKMPLDIKNQIIMKKTPLIEISSTDIRKRLTEGKSIKYMVPPPVESYIQKKHLYFREMSSPEKQAKKEAAP